MGGLFTNGFAQRAFPQGGKQALLCKLRIRYILQNGCLTSLAMLDKGGCGEFLTSRPNRNPMKQQIEIYLHSAGTTEERIIKVPEDATIRDVLEAAQKAGITVDADTFLIAEDTDDELPGDARINDHGVKHKHHLLCHRCRKVEVSVTFNGTVKSRKFAPSRKAKQVLKWAVEAFELIGVDAENKELRVSGANGTILQSQQHIGSFVHSPHCSLDLYLTAIVEVQG